MSRIPLDNFPLTFRDAILITRRLGYQYLWIDSLCIIQDSIEDWQREAASMDYIYKHASLTIAAEAGGDSSAGIFRSTNETRSHLTTIEVLIFEKTIPRNGLCMFINLLTLQARPEGL